ncbi:2-octaprenyl-6-methoxyphenol hydroxylase [Vibrio aerogenes CECT 7868]|uniref:2-octaprenyl-6-methoxyphenol hydroxylase n=1 Tax=Vibrio aerogenes CECT 7868 TaxID=1216006 RepID=A0A1M5YIF8_9VIBR|nr:2-octaprenyl-6-methoxyphenyl hydroxylase [Vibrio aerogenes]SHI11827.1 2-octaprenyl-6-methoxyphenol hydroxylase [Vibrio aerogenes CECT 7868]
MQLFDIVISGGAMTGATLALALNQRFNGQLSIAVVEAFDAGEQQHPGFDARAIALSDGTVRILQSFDLWQHILPYATPIKHIHVSDAGHAGMTDIEPEQAGLSVLGYVVELADVGRIYTELLKQCSAVSFFCPHQIEKIDRQCDMATVTLKDYGDIQTKLLVAADGSASTCCELLGHQAEEYDFDQSAVIANVQISGHHQGRAFERFTPTGPVAMLPMTNERMSMVWCMEPGKARQLLTEQNFDEKLQQVFGWRLGKIQRVGERSVYPLKMMIRSRTVSHRFAVVGNAAQTLHPIAGQGFNLGIRDVATFVECLAQQAQNVGDISGLLKYQQRRSSDRIQTAGVTSSLVSLFSNQWFPAEISRNLGLMLFDQIPLFKQPLLKRTLGHVTR